MRVAGILGAIVLSATVATAYVPSLVFESLGGSLQIAQSVPCGDEVNVSTPIAGGRMEVIPLVGMRTGGVEAGFHLTRLDVSFAPFAVQHSCKGLRAAVEYRAIGVKLTKGVQFTGEEVGAPEDQIYRFTIPKEDFLIFQTVVSTEPAPQPQTAYQKPSQDVTGLIDLRQGTVELNVVVASQLHFRAGCIQNRCRIDEKLDGTLTTQLRAQVPARR
jgi:hypothetical protein